MCSPERLWASSRNRLIVSRHDVHAMVKGKSTLPWAVLSLLPGSWALLVRPLLPLDELRALSVGWEMWSSGDFLVPHLNGVPYSHKPPLLYWLMHAGWAVFGVNEWWPRLIVPFCALTAILLTVQLARELWPDDPQPARIAPWILCGSLGWIVFSQMLMFDVLMTVFVLIAAIGMWRAAYGGNVASFAAIAVGIGGGLLSKGPVALVFILTPALLAPLWSSQVRSRAGYWYPALLLSLAGGAAMAGLWALPAARAGGEAYAAAIFWGQTAGRVEDSFAHARSWWSYLVFLPVLLLPWTCWLPIWRGGRTVSGDQGARFVIIWAVAVLVVQSFFSAKQPHYVVPLLAPLSLLLARRLDVHAFASVRALALAGLTTVLVIGSIYFLSGRGDGMDLRKPALAVSRLQGDGAQLAIYGGYKGQIGFLGRLRPIPIVGYGTARRWAPGHPGAYLVSFHEGSPDGLDLEDIARFPYMHRRMHIWRVPATSDVGERS